MLFEQIYTRRGWLASVPSLVVIVLAALWARQSLPVKPAVQTDTTIALRMTELPPPPRPAQIAPPPVPRPPEQTKPVLTPPKPVPVVRERSAPPVSPAAQPVPPVAAASDKPPTTPPAQAPRTDPKPAAPAATPAPAPSPAPAAVASPPPAPTSARVEASYITQLRAQLERSKRYPTGREASLMRPSGMVRVWLVLDRSGRLLDSGVEQSSHAMLLDHAALSSVRRGEYPAFPADSWPGDSSHRFTVDLNYTPAN